MQSTIRPSWNPLPRLIKNAKHLISGRAKEPEISHTILLEDHKVIYFYIPKVACSSLKKVCVDLLGMQIPEGKTVHRIDYPSIARKDLDTYQDYFKFAFVRNPWDRLVSCYRNKIMPEPNQGDYKYTNGVFNDFLRYGVFRAGMSFADFVNAVADIPDPEAEPHFRSQHTFLTDAEGHLLVDYVGKFETLHLDFAEVCRRMGIAPMPLPHLMKSSSHPYQQAYNLTLKAQVRQRYAHDIERFSYEF